MNKRTVARNINRGPQLCRRGFSIVELLLGIALAAVSGSYLLVAMDDARANAREMICSSNLKQLAIAQHSYATDFQDSLATFTWSKKTPGRSQFADLQRGVDSATNDAQHATMQAVDTIRRRSRRNDVPVPKSWFPYPQYSNLVLQDYLASRLPEPLIVCPDDRVRASWQEHVGTFPKGPKLVPANAADQSGVLPYSSSYQHVPAMYDKLPLGINEEQARLRVRQGTQHDRYLINELSRLGPSSYGFVAFPSAKVMIMDSHDRHSEVGQAGPRYFADGAASQPLGFFDGSVRPGATADANPGWDPHRPDSPDPTVIKYAPQAWETAPLEAGGSQHFVGSYRWTRNGLGGIDFNGAEQGMEPVELGEGFLELDR